MIAIAANMTGILGGNGMENKRTHSIPAWVKRRAVRDCQTVEEFAHKYRKAERFTGRGKDYAQSVLSTHCKELEEYGYTLISPHDNVTGQTVTFIGKENTLKENE